MHGKYVPFHEVLSFKLFSKVALCVGKDQIVQWTL